MFDDSSMLARSYAPPLTGCSNVRKLSFLGYQKEKKVDVARHLCGIGSPDTVYVDVIDEETTGKNTFHHITKDERKKVVSNISFNDKLELISLM